MKNKITNNKRRATKFQQIKRWRGLEERKGWGRTPKTARNQRKTNKEERKEGEEENKTERNRSGEHARRSKKAAGSTCQKSERVQQEQLRNRWGKKNSKPTNYHHESRKKLSTKFSDERQGGVMGNGGPDGQRKVTAVNTHHFCRQKFLGSEQFVSVLELQLLDASHRLRPRKQDMQQLVHNGSLCDPVEAAAVCASMRTPANDFRKTGAT
jgi:hypothetical protein